MTKAGAPIQGSAGDSSAGNLAASSATLTGPPRAAEALASDPLPSAGSPQDGGFNLAFVVRTLNRRQGLFLVTFAIVTGALSLNTLRQRLVSPVYQGGFQIQVRSPFESSNNFRTIADEGSFGAIARSNVNTDANALTVLLRSPLLIAPLAKNFGVGTNEIINNLAIFPVSTGSGNRVNTVDSILNVTLNWRDPGQGRAIMTALSQSYTRFSLEQRQQALDSGIKFLDRQAPEIQSVMTKLQAEMMQFRKRNDSLDPNENVKEIIANREELLRNLRSLQRQQVTLRSQLDSLVSGRLRWSPSGTPNPVAFLGREGTATPAPASSVKAATSGKTPLEQLNEVETSLAEARAVYREDTPMVQSLLARRNKLLPVVQGQAADEVRSKLLANIAEQDEVNRQILLLNQNFRNNPQKLREYDDLQTRLNLARERYTSYIQSRENFRLELARSTTPWQVISPTEFADVPVEPNLQRKFLQALLFGLLAGMGMALLRERTDNVFHTPMDAEKELQLPVLGLIPFLPLDPGVQIASSIARMSRSERFAIKESLRSLFTTFRLLRADRNIRLVGITSSSQGEGKSTAVSIFAQTLADLGLKVLIVDADMRLPMQTRYLGIEAGEGLSSLLSDPSLRVTDLIQPVSDNFDVLPSGPKPPDPARLLNSARCQDVVDEIRGLIGYDLVMWDSPPCLMLADPILLGEKLDGILFLVGLGQVNRDVAPQACRRIKATGVDVLGLICNQVTPPTRLNDYGYEYGYHYHYAYSGTYGRAGQSNYAQGLGRYMGRYRNAYLDRSQGGDVNRVNGNTKQAYQQAQGSPPDNGSGNGGSTPRSRSMRRSGSSAIRQTLGWIRHLWPIGGRSMRAWKGDVQPSERKGSGQPQRREDDTPGGDSTSS